MNRRTFIKLISGGLAGAAAVVAGLPGAAPEQLLWVPDKTIQTAQSIEEAVTSGLLAVWPNGAIGEFEISSRHGGLTFEQNLEAHIQSIERSGGRIVRRGSWIAA